MQVCCCELKVLEARKEFEDNKTTNNSHLRFLHQGQPERERKQLLSLRQQTSASFPLPSRHCNHPQQEWPSPQIGIVLVS